MTETANTGDLLALTTEIVAAHVSNNTVTVADLPQLINQVYQSLSTIGTGPAPAVERPWNHPCYDPLWSLCEELDVPIALHPATHVDFPNAVRLFDLINREANISINNRGTDELHGGGAISHAVGAPVDAIVAMGRFILGGVCERFPRLRILFLPVVQREPPVARPFVEPDRRQLMLRT